MWQDYMTFLFTVYLILISSMSVSLAFVNLRYSSMSKCSQTQCLSTFTERDSYQNAFINAQSCVRGPILNYNAVVTSSSTRLYSDKNTKQKKGSLEGGVRTKLLSESIAPWRSLRLFLYVSFASGAMIGGLITLTGTLALLSGAKEGNLNTELLNLGIDFGAVAVFAFLFKWDLDKEAELRDKVVEKLELKKESERRSKKMKEREQELGTLSLDIQVGMDGKTQAASVRELQAGARQHMIIVAGPKKACRDALIGANLLKMDFAMSNVLVVPYDTDAAAVVTSDTAISSKPATGFGSTSDSKRPIYETQAYVARPTGEGWSDFIKAEIRDAVEQNGEKVKEEGIAIVVANTGKIIRRGVGKVPWRQMVEQLDQSVKQDVKATSFFQ